MGQSEWKSSYDDADRFAGVKKVFARIFGDGENPLAWGFSFVSLFGMRYKIHLALVVYLLAQLIFTLPGHKSGPIFVVPSLIAMVVLALLHEMAHAFVGKRNGGENEHRMLWMLGGLEPTQFDDPNERGELRTALAGMALHVALIPVFVIPLVLLTGTWNTTIFNPLSPSLSIPSLMLESSQTTPWWLVVIWSFHVVNLIILMCNLIPMAPFDAADVLRILMSRKHGDLVARHKVAFAGLWVATGVGLIGLLFVDAKILLGIAILSGIVCTIERRRIQFLGGESMYAGFKSEALDAGSFAPDQSKAPSTKLEPDSESDLDAILEKISISGIESLSRKERRTLKKATESSRNTEGTD